MVDEIEASCHAQPRSEIPSKEIGEQVMHKLREADEVAYVRFAGSVYRDFKDMDCSFTNSKKLRRQKRPVNNSEKTKS